MVTHCSHVDQWVPQPSSDHPTSTLALVSASRCLGLAQASLPPDLAHRDAKECCSNLLTGLSLAQLLHSPEGTTAKWSPLESLPDPSPHGACASSALIQPDIASLVSAFASQATPSPNFLQWALQLSTAQPAPILAFHMNQ